MKFELSSILALALVASSEAFAPLSSSSASATKLQAEIGDTGVAFENVAREWRCKVRCNPFRSDVQYYDTEP